MVIGEHLTSMCEYYLFAHTGVQTYKILFIFCRDPQLPWTYHRTVTANSSPRIPPPPPLPPRVPLSDLNVGRSSGVLTPTNGKLSTTLGFKIKSYVKYYFI